MIEQTVNRKEASWHHEIAGRIFILCTEAMCNDVYTAEL